MAATVRSLTAARDWELWSTTGRLVVTRPETLPAATRVVDALLAEVERAASRFRPDSEIMTLAPAADGWVSLSPELAALLRTALDAARRTDGALDPTVGGTLVDLGYDRDISLVIGDDGSAVARVRRVPGWRTLQLDGNRLRMPPGVVLDLGATAKAAAADRAATLVAEQLHTGVLVGLGGDIATAGPAPTGGWQITVQDTAHDPATQVGLPAGAAIATSSTVRRAWHQGGEPRHHLVDPRTSRPAVSPLRSVTVAAASCVDANAAATATLVKGPAGPAWLAATGLAARMVTTDGEVRLLGDWPTEEAA